MILIFWKLFWFLRYLKLRIKTGLDEVLDLTVQDFFGLAAFVVGAMIFDHLVGVEHIRTDLVAPAALKMFALKLA